ncbi:MAG: carbohydrate kinase [Cytophagaceae bacterium]|nr:carbohydrate kinase [Cytophagaceae bacterium]MBK9932732.1 carbohydrate kinase [Cytophagaceae bacterium]MBL0303577.1 carbohydrate kinase [Cytophagaceae bacterium]MBL0326406.1 carbohydrate kinase [Cytophagaceae bacterium]
MFLLGIDLGTSSIKASIVESATGQEVASAQYPEIEAEIIAHQKGWAEQDPQTWWEYSQQAIKKAIASAKIDGKKITAIGISYQMHGLVMVDKNQEVLRHSIIWCDSRAIKYGESAFEAIGKEKALGSLLNSPGNFTAAKLAWVKENEPDVFEKCDKIMLPGDFLAMKLTGEITTTASGLSEGIFWDFPKNQVSEDVLKAFGFTKDIIPTILPVFASHGNIKADIAESLGLSPEAVVAYKAGDQPNNAFSLNVVNPGEIAATAGTSGVVYAVSDKISYDPLSRINSFAHVNHGDNDLSRIGILLCINGTGILNRWIKEQVAGGKSYQEMNEDARKISVGSDGLIVMPFGNGAERMLQNKLMGAQMLGLDFNTHKQAHIFRAAQEGIVFSFKYGFDIMLSLGVVPNVIRAGQANMFLSDVFTQTLVNTTQVPVEMYDTHGAKGAALGAGVGAKVYADIKEAMSGLKILKTIEPVSTEKEKYENAYKLWEQALIL